VPTKVEEQTVKDHNLVDSFSPREILFEHRPALDREGQPVEGLHNIWITLNNPAELNAYTTDMIKEIILAVRRASNDRAAVAVVLTGAGTQAFCTGGNTREYAEVYAGAPAEYRQYMRLFNDMVSAVLHCDKPVVCRVNGMRVGGGQEVGMACDFSIASDLAVFSQAGPKHGSAPDGGSTDFLPLYVGFAHSMESGVLCEMWSAHKALYLGLLNKIVPALTLDGSFVPNPMVITDRMVDEFGNIVFGDYKEGADNQRAKEILSRAKTDLSKLDEAVEQLCTRLLMLMPESTSKTINSIRKHKQWHWDNTSVTNREWLALNMMTEGRAGFRAFNEGPKDHREVDFIRLRQLLAQGHPWDEEMHREISPQYHQLQEQP